VNKALPRRLVYALVAMQLLLAAPTASALVSAAATAVVAAHEHDSCPCCADDPLVDAACLSACASAVALLPVTGFTLTRTIGASLVTVPTVLFTPLADPPLKPPPIV
jgi:hypothetical protein